MSQQWRAPHDRQQRRSGLRALGALLAAGSTVLGAAVAAPAAGASPAAGTPPAHSAAATASALDSAFAAGRHLPGADVAGVRAGSLRTTRLAGGEEWALATFAPSASATGPVRTAFQDGASTGLFHRAPGGAWQLVSVGPEQGTCHDAAPAAARRGLGLTAAACPSPAHPAVAARSAAAAIAGAAQGSRGADIARIALGQVGVADTPASVNFGDDCDPYTTLVGPPTPNATDCGVDPGFKVVNENEPWCSDFAKWVWQQAGVTTDMDSINAGSVSFYGWGRSQGESLPVDGNNPQVGDAVVFFPAGAVSANGYADHVGIVTAMHPDGTVDLVNGDFSGSSNISVEYDTNLDLSTWAPSVWGPGEQWVYVAPPSGPQAATPPAAVAGPSAAVAGSTATFSDPAAPPAGSPAVAAYLWTFGDGGTATTPTATHVFNEPGPHTATLTTASPGHTVTTRTWNVQVAASSAAATAQPSNAVWYSTTPVFRQVFTPTTGGTLLEQRDDGPGWTAAALPGTVDPSAVPTALTEPGPADVLTPEVVSETPSGGLQLTTPGAAAPIALPGSAAPAATVAATAVPAGGSLVTDVFYVDASGTPSEDSNAGGSWTATHLPLPPAASSHLATAVTSDGSGFTTSVFEVDRHGLLEVASTIPGRPGWHRSTIAAAAPAPASPLAATAGPGGGTSEVFWVGSDGALHAAAAPGASPAPPGGHRVATLPGMPSATGGLSATEAVTGPGATAPQVGFVTTGGVPTVDTADVNGSWTASTLPGTATSMDGLAAFPENVGPSEVNVPGPSVGADRTAVLRNGGHFSVDTSSRTSGTWSPSALPAAATTVPDAVVLYAATTADLAAARSAAASAGLPASSVTGDFPTAWDDSLGGDHLVISVGQAATDALYDNPCGWSNPSGAIAYSTPFGYVLGPTDALPGAELFVDGNASPASATPSRVADLAYYAAHGNLPPGTTTVPAAAGATFACAGSPSVS